MADMINIANYRIELIDILIVSILYLHKNQEHDEGQVTIIGGPDDNNGR